MLKNLGTWYGTQQWTVDTEESQQYFYRIPSNLDWSRIYLAIIYFSTTSVAIEQVPKEVALQQLAALKLSN